MLAKTTSLAVPKKTYLNHQLLYKNACITAKSLDYSKIPALESRTKHYNSSPFAKNAGNSLPKARLSAFHQPLEHVVSLRDQFWDLCYL